MKSRLTTVLTVLSLGSCLLISLAWILDRDSATSREMTLAARYSEHMYALLLFEGNVYLAAFRIPESTGWELHCGTDHGFSLGFYCFAIVHELGHTTGNSLGVSALRLFMDDLPTSCAGRELS